MSINLVMLSGFVGKEPEVKNVNGFEFATFSLATSKVSVDKDGNKKEKTTWHNLKLLGDKKTKLCQYIKKGDKIAITGEIDQSKYTDKDGVEKTSFSILVNAIDLPKKEQQMVDSHNKAKANGYQGQDDSSEDEIPF